MVSKYPILNILLELEGKDLIAQPIKDLRKKLKDSCELYGIDDVKEINSLLSKERRREKKAIYSAQERERNDCKYKNIEIDLGNLEEDAQELRGERLKLINEINYYQKQMNDLRNESDIVCCSYADQLDMLSKDILELLEPTP